MKTSALISFCVVVLFTACAAGEPDHTESPGGVQTAVEGRAVPYDFERPDRSIELHDDLTELSGFTMLPDGNLAAVQDEDGIIFVLDSDDGAIVDRIEFAGDGDYEGIERVGDLMYVLRSNGTLIEVAGWTTDNPRTREIETFLRSRNDTEGLAHDAGRLLIACKEEPGEGIDEQFRAIYAFDIGQGTLYDEPVLTIDTEALQEMDAGDGPFKPSAVASHPDDGSLFVLSSTSRQIAIIDRAGSLREAVSLPADLFEQPESLAFATDGTIYVGSEGGDGQAVIHVFSPE